MDNTRIYEFKTDRLRNFRLPYRWWWRHGSWFFEAVHELWIFRETIRIFNWTMYCQLLFYNLQVIPWNHCLTFWHLSLWLDGNGFKTSTMRLGADAIVFTCCTKSRYHITSLKFLSFCEPHFFVNWNDASYYLFSVGLHNPLVSSLTLSWWKLDIQML